MTDADRRVELTGYADRWSVAPGETVKFMVSTDDPQYRATILQLFHGDRNPEGPGFKQEELATTVTGNYEGRRQRTFPGSYGVVSGLPENAWGFGLAAWVYPTTPDWAVPQCVMSRFDAAAEEGFGLFVSEGCLSLRVVRGNETQDLQAESRLEARRWYFVYAGLDQQLQATLEYESCAWPESGERIARRLEGASTFQLDDSLFFAACAGPDGPRFHYNGKIASPQLFDLALGPDEVRMLAESRACGEVARDRLLGGWNLGSAPASDRFDDASGHGLSGVLVNRPMSAVTDHKWDGTALDWKTKPEHYEAVHFHTDDLADANWDIDFAWEVPGDVKSGIYAAWVRGESREDHIPFVVRPARTDSTAEIGFLLPTFTYLAYGNERMRSDEALAESGVFGRGIDPDPRDQEFYEHDDYGLSLYDVHADGSGSCYASAKRPILNWRPDYKMWMTGAPRDLGADLYLTDWLREKGFDHDTFTDGDLHIDGEALLSRYRVLLTGGHPEYWSEKMLDALQQYLDSGGRVMYLGGNGFYWVTSVSETDPHIIEVRRGHAGTRAWESAPGENFQSSTGEPGGLWRHRGRPPNKLLGVGFASEGWSERAPGYTRNPDATGFVADFVFDGVESGEFGDYGLVMGGAAGDEIDRADPSRGTPAHAVLLASSTGHDDFYQLVVEDVLLTTPGLGGSANPDVRADMVFMETPMGGAVFSVGSISWRGSLSHNGYDNDVSRITENVLKTFLAAQSWADDE